MAIISPITFRGVQDYRCYVTICNSNKSFLLQDHFKAHNLDDVTQRVLRLDLFDRLGLTPTKYAPFGRLDRKIMHQLRDAVKMLELRPYAWQTISQASSYMWYIPAKFGGV